MEKTRILNKGSFLIKKGYQPVADSNVITYTNGDIEFNIIYEPNSPVSEMDVKFLNLNELFNVGWIAFVRDGVKVNSYDRLNCIFDLLAYVEKHYSEITDYNYCKESDKLVDEYIAKNKKN